MMLLMMMNMFKQPQQQIGPMGGVGDILPPQSSTNTAGFNMANPDMLSQILMALIGGAGGGAGGGQGFPGMPIGGQVPGLPF